MSRLNGVRRTILKISQEQWNSTGTASFFCEHAVYRLCVLGVEPHPRNQPAISMMSKLKRKAQRLAGDREAELWKSDRLVARFFKDKG
jgi:hypothetical protein